jgi:hypothetical protein
MSDIKSKVAEWNAQYEVLGNEVRLKDMSPEVYEATVGSELLAVCEEDPEIALMVLDHPDTEGGWMMGDVAKWLQAKRGY